MDYEQKYKDALERAKNLHKDAIDMGENIRAKQCEIIFPELAESEGERVRKGLVKAVSGTLEGNKLFGTDVTREEALAWLEKQGKQKETLCDKCKKEQPSHSCHDITALGRCALEKQGEHKPAWSKADKRMMDLIISVFEVNHPKSIFKDGLRAVYTDEIVSWLKSIEDRMKGE